MLERIISKLMFVKFLVLNSLHATLVSWFRFDMRIYATHSLCGVGDARDTIGISFSLASSISSYFPAL